MNPDFNTTQSNTRRVLIFVGAAMLLLFGVLALFSWLSSANHQEYQLSSTAFRGDRNFTHLSGGDLYSYNGLAFSKTNTDSTQVTVLAAGDKLPTPSALYWADSRGALMNFNGSFGRTKIEQQLQSSGQLYDEAALNYTWYYNFQDKSLSKVSDYPITANQAAFSATDKGFYYIPDHSSIGTDDFEAIKSELHFYSIDTKQDRVVSNDLKVVRINHFSACTIQNYHLCVIARNSTGNTNLHVYGVNPNGEVKSVLESTGRLVATNSPEQFVTTDQATGNATSSDEDATYTEAPAKLHNLKDGSTAELGFNFSDELILPYIKSTSDFYVLNIREIGKYLSGGLSTLGSADVTNLPLKLPNGSDFQSTFQENISYGDRSVALVTDAENNQYLFAPTGQQKSLDGIDQKTAKGIVETCIKTSGGDSSEFTEELGQFRVYFKDDSNFVNNITTFSDCVIKANNKITLGHTFYFGGKSPLDGRFTTD
jgi:hypothetical protein